IGRNFAQVSSIGKIVKAISDNRQPSVNHFERSYFEIPSETKRRAVDYRVGNELRQPAPEVSRFKHILKNPTDVFPGTLVRVEPQRAITKIQGPNVVKAEDVICVTMCHQHRVEVSQPNL